MTALGPHVNRRSGALAVVIVSTIGNALAYASAFSAGGAPTWAARLFAVCTVTLLSALIAMGARRGNRPLGALIAPIALTASLLLVGFVAALVVAPVTAATPLVGGLPVGAAIVVYGIGLIPMLILPVAYALTFSNLTLTDDDLKRVRDVGEAMRADAVTHDETVP